MYQEWLRDKLVDDEKFWGKVPYISFSKFLSEYTLHDSGWYRLTCEPEKHKITAFFIWDTYWTNGRVPFDKKSGYPLLMINIPIVYNLFFSDFNQNTSYTVTISDASTRTLSEEERKLWLGITGQLEVDTLHTVIEGLDSEKTHILHSPKVQIRCFNQSGNELLIPGL